RQTVEAGDGKFYELEYYKCFSRATSRALQDHLKAHRWLVKTLRHLPKPLGVAAASDDVALRVMRACDDAKLYVPEEVAVLGCHNDPLICDYAPVPLSSVDDDLERIGYEGAKLLDRLMDGKPASCKPILIPPKG
ncbi:MAG: substrate-binding domain-containing protein, partial [Limisphaerales bacterium]